MRRMCLFFILVFLIGSVAWWCGLRLNVTPSLPIGVYRVIPEVPERGDMAMFCLEGESAALAAERGYLEPGSCASGLRPLLKYFAGLPGDNVTVTSKKLVVGPVTGPACIWSAPTLPLDKNGQELAPKLHSGTIPPGKALVLAFHPGSFDSRYFGLVPLDSLQRTVPLFIWTSNKGKNDD